MVIIIMMQMFMYYKMELTFYEIEYFLVQGMDILSQKQQIMK